MKYFSSKLTTVDKIVFVVLIAFTLAGVALTNMSPNDAHIYWLVMTLVFAIGAIMTGWQRATEKGEKKQLVTSQFLHWEGALIGAISGHAAIGATTGALLGGRR